MMPNMPKDVSEILDKRVVTIQYHNHRGQTVERTILPLGLRYCSTEWHPGQPQWMMDAIDVHRGVERTFAVKDILKWGI